MNPLISVIIPVYNSEKYLPRCLESVLAQDYRPLEVIFVNDGSTDTSEKICTDFTSNSSEDFKVRIISQQNQGASIARKNGIEKAAGEFLTFIDSDDFVSPKYVSALYEALKEHKTSIAVCPYYVFKEGEQILTQTDVITSSVISENEVLDKFFKYQYWGFGGGVYNHLLFDQVRFSDITVYEDYYVKAQIFTSTTKVAEINIPLYFYEKHEGSLSNLKLSIRALGEFDNALSTWEFIKQYKPKYFKQALAIVSEVACKWLGVLNNTDKINIPEYNRYYHRIKDFIKRNLTTIFTNPHILWKIKIVLIRELICHK